MKVDPSMFWKTGTTLKFVYSEKHVFLLSKFLYMNYNAYTKNNS